MGQKRGGFDELNVLFKTLCDMVQNKINLIILYLLYLIKD